MADLDQARAAKARLRTVLSGHDGVCGIGLTQVPDGYGLQVNLERSDADDLPGTVDGVPVQVRVVGPVRTQG